MSAETVRVRLWAALMLCLLCLPLVWGGWYVWQKHVWATDRLAELEPRYARLQGLVDSEAAVREASEKAATEVRRHTYHVSVDATQAGNDAQQRIREVFSASGLTVSSSQALPAKEDGALDHIPVALAVEGQLFQFQAAMLALGALQPAVWVEAVSLRPAGLAPPSTSPRLAGQFRFFVLRERS